MKDLTKRIIQLILLMGILYACKGPEKLFVTSHHILIDSIQKLESKARKGTIIEKFVKLRVQVYTNKGERLIDPNKEFDAKGGGGSLVDAKDNQPAFTVKSDGFVELPMVGNVYLEGKTLFEADSLLNIEYEKYYNGVFILSEIVSSRVIVLGPEGGKVIPLHHEKMNLIEVLALYGGVTAKAKGSNIRRIRGDLSNPQVEIIDLTTIEGMKKANLNVWPNEIIYIEMADKSLMESLKESLPLLQVAASLVTIFLLIFSLANR